MNGKAADQFVVPVAANQLPAAANEPPSHTRPPAVSKRYSTSCTPAPPSAAVPARPVQPDAVAVEVAAGAVIAAAGPAASNVNDAAAGVPTFPATSRAAADSVYVTPSVRAAGSKLEVQPPPASAAGKVVEPP